MQMAAPELTDLSKETAATKASTAWTKTRPRTSAAAACWPGGWWSAACASSRSGPAARRAAATGTATPSATATTSRSARKSDKPIAGLLADLKSRGLLDCTLVIWGGEFGRTPTSDGSANGGGDSKGRDHNPYGFSMWMAGGGVKGGKVIGSTDEIGLRAVEYPGPCARPARHHSGPAGSRP